MTTTTTTTTQLDFSLFHSSNPAVRAAFCKKLVSQLQQNGFARLTNHGVPASGIDKAFETVCRPVPTHFPSPSPIHLPTNYHQTSIPTNKKMTKIVQTLLPPPPPPQTPLPAPSHRPSTPWLLRLWDRERFRRFCNPPLFLPDSSPETSKRHERILRHRIPLRPALRQHLASPRPGVVR